MKLRLAHLALVFGFAGAVSVGCSSDDDTTSMPKAGAGGTAGHAGRGGSGGRGGSTPEGGSAGSAEAGSSEGGSSEAGTAGQGEAGAAQAGAAGEGGGAGTGGYTQAQIDRGKVIVRSMALCGGCHTKSGEPELSGNPNFKNGTLPAPNLTNDATGIGEWTDEQVINAFRNGIDDEGRHLDPTMPYWLFHNMSDADALSVVAFLRSLTPVAGSYGADLANTAVTPLSPSSLPNTTLATSSPDYAAAETGKYLVSGVVQCVKCHSPASAGLPVPEYFSGVPPTSSSANFAPNLTPDDSGLASWTADDVAKALKQGVDKAGRTLCNGMPAASRGYGGMSDADAHAIGVYLTTIPGVSKPAADPDLQPACPASP